MWNYNFRKKQTHTCATMRRRLSRQLEGDLPPAAAEELAAHLAGCAGCRRWASAEQALHKRLLAEVDPPWIMPPAARAYNRPQIRRRLRRKNLMVQTRQTVRGLAALVLFLLLAAGVFWWWQNYDLESLAPINTPVPQETEQVTITLAGWPSYQLANERLIQEFQEEHPHIHVQYVSFDEQTVQLSPREMASLADVILLGGRPTSEAATFFLDLTPLMDADPAFDADDFWPDVLDACQASGVQVGLPLQVNAGLILFDKDAFDAVGLPYPAPGWSWEQFQQAAERLTARDGEQTRRYGFLDSGHSLLLLGPLVDSIIGHHGYDARQLAMALEWYVALADQGIIPVHSGDRMADVMNRDVLLRNRQAAMWVGSQSDLNTWRGTFGDKLGAAPFPASSATAGSNAVTVHCALISAGTTQAQAAWTWLNYLSTQSPVTGDFQAATPVRPSVAASSGYWAQMERDIAAAVQYALEHGWYGREMMAEVRAVGDALNRALAGQVTLAEALPDTIDSQPVIVPLPPDAPITVATPQATAAPDKDVLIVDYYAGGHPNIEAVVALARAFNESQELVVVRPRTARPDIQGGYGVLEMAEVYDCFTWNGWAGAYAYNPSFSERFYSLDPLMDAETAAFREDFDEGQLEQNRIDGSLFALPVAVQPYVIQYNADLLAELGLNPPVPGWTTDEFWTLAEAATRNDRERQAYGFVPNNLRSDDLLLFVPGAEHFIDVDDNPPSPTFDEPAVARALTWLASMVESGALFPVDTNRSRTNWEYDRSQQQQQYSLITQGRAAMWVHFVGSGAGGPPLPFNTGTAPFPQTHLAQVSGLGPVPTMAVISKRTADPSGCWEWLKFLSAQPDAFFGAPARRSVQESPAWRAAVGEEAAAAYQIMAARSRHSLLYWATHPYPMWWADALHDVFSGSDPATVLQEIQAKAEFFYTCYVGLEEPEFEEVRGCLLQADPEIQRE